MKLRKIVLPMIRFQTIAIVTLLVFSSCGVNDCLGEQRPNVVMFIADDVSWNDFGCYGNGAARTPHIDRLAAQGMRFDQAFLTASSCSPSRSSIVTGRYPHNNGKAAELHLPIAANLPWFPELLRQSGYYTALSGKNHMTIQGATAKKPLRAPAFDHIDGGRERSNSGGHAHWVAVTRDRPQDKPFFFWFASYDAHRDWDADHQWDADRYGPKHSAASVRVPPFLIDDEITADDVASYYNEVTRFDYYVGQVVDQLREQNVLDDTLILVLADNGRPFPRAKTRLHDSGMKTALVVHWPSKIKQPAVCDGLVSVIDIAPTILSAAGVTVPETMQGVSMLPLFDDPQAQTRRYAFSEHNWHDYEAHGRSVRDGKFLYIQNNRPALAWQGPADSVRSPSHTQLRKNRDRGSLNPAQQDVFAAPRPTEELYLVSADPDQLDNLIDKAPYATDANRLRKLMQQWTQETGDSVPAAISGDFFDRETGKQLPIKADAYRGTTPGEENHAATINAPGPR